MKPTAMTWLLAVSFLISFKVEAQPSKENSIVTTSIEDKPQQISIDKFPKNMVINHIDGWGTMTVAVNELPAGTDLSPLLMGLKNNSCQVPHWGYIVKGKMRLIYDDGTEVVLKAGDLFYMPPEHKGNVVEDLKLLDFSPEKEMKDLIKHIEQKVAKPN